MLSVLYACLICINFNKYLHTLIKQIFDGSHSLRCTFVKCSAFNLFVYLHIYLRCYCYRCIGFWLYQVDIKYILL